MTKHAHFHTLKQLFTQWSGEDCLDIVALTAAGSARKYYRLSGKNQSAIGLFSENTSENNAFCRMSSFFNEYHFPSPKLYLVSDDQQCYLQEDLGNECLLDRLQFMQDKFPQKWEKKMLPYYQKAIEALFFFQEKSQTYHFNYDWVYRNAYFGKQQLLFDVQYFKYYFLQPAKIVFNAEKLENDFDAFIDSVLHHQLFKVFMHRDFQSRNLMLRQDELFVIDYQGAKFGPWAYDLTSLLFQAKAGLTDDFRRKVLQHYFEIAHNLLPLQWEEVLLQVYIWAYLRIFQTLGAYGYRGWFEGKAHFLQSMPMALENLKSLMVAHPLPESFSELNHVLEACINFNLPQMPSANTPNLHVNLYSFSYKKPLPKDYSEHGGGYLFDCRAIPNPGRWENMKHLSGKDVAVQTFLENDTQFQAFWQHSSALIRMHLQAFWARRFNYLSIGFGCTGGQHRSVYCAEKTKQWIAENFPSAKVSLVHWNEEEWDGF
ncbi:MAG: RNase adapter RapZ [Chitinophagales bacterium]|nr:phosphotransferase [Bacteroidota bacterium]MCB9043354.1 phosphotransferase [Chitinophagales bacterium]